MADEHGWSKSDRLLAERKKRREENRPQPLEPRFPWRCIAFDVRAFGRPAKPAL
ncbi:MAG TPA: hypothetical protein PLA50_04810 [Bacteroidia bacterium]|nr:hypothetical protein [Bacteroidia bacterium]